MTQPAADGTNVTFTNAAAKQGVIGFVPTRVETVEQGAGITLNSQEQSFAAACELNGDGFSATFKSPATINLPSYGDIEKPITLECSNRDKTRKQTYKVVNLSQKKRTGNAIAVGVLLSPLAGGIMAGTGAAPKDQDVYGYSNMKLSF